MSTGGSNVTAPVMVPGFDEAGFRSLDMSGESELVRAAREEAFRVYAGLPMPTRALEEWRRTDPALFPFAKARILPKLQRQAEAPVREGDEAFDVVVAVSDAGFAIRDMSGVLGQERTSVLPLDEAARRFPDAIREYLARHAARKGAGKFEALNDAFWNFGLFIHVPAGVALERGILVRHEYAACDAVVLPRLVMMAGERSRAVLVERLASAASAHLVAVSAREVFAAESAAVKVIGLHEWGPQAHHIASDWGVAARDAKLEWVALNLGGRVSKLSLGGDCAGEGATAELDGLYFASDDQHVDQRTLQVHSAPNTYSRLLYKGVVEDRAHSVYQGLIVAKAGASKVDAYQKNNNLVLDDGARADSLPGLEIDTDDLKCSHGSTIGNLDPEELFYLRSRGLDENEARSLLIEGFFEEVAARIPYGFLQESVREQVRRRIRARRERARA